MIAQPTPAVSRRVFPSVVLALLLMTALAGLWSASDAQGYPEPSLVPRGYSLMFSHGKPKPIAVKDPATDTYRWYWYVTYKVTNIGPKEILFGPEAAIASDAGDLIDAGKGVPAAVFPAIKAKEGNKLLEDPMQVVGRLLVGEDYAKESVIVWPAFDHDADNISVFVAGLSGEAATIPNPKTGEPVVVRKTLMLNYFTPGAHVKPDEQPVEAKSEKWIMR